MYWDMASHTLEYEITFIGIWHHINCNILSYLLEYAVIFNGIFCHIYWNMLSYLLNMLSYLLEYIIIFSGICDKNYIQTITSVKFLGGMPSNNSKNIDI